MTSPRQQLGFWMFCVAAAVALILAAYRVPLIARFHGRGANLRRTSLSGVSLRDVDLTGADLREATLLSTDLQGAILTGANLQRVLARGADLSGAQLSGADLRRADLREASLKDADLRGADLRGATLECCHDEHRSTDLHGARFDAATRWPDGFIPEGHGARLAAR